MSTADEPEPFDPDLEMEIEFAVAMEMDRLTAFDDETQRGRVVLELVTLREAFGLTQTDIGKRMGVEQPTVSQFENGADPRLSTLQRYARALGAKVMIVVFPLVKPPIDETEGFEG
jgi:DNA-binding XRE family transcriptional regulator